MTTRHRALDLYAGLGGWDFAVRHITGAESFGVEIMPEAVESRRLNGMPTLYNDVWDIERAADLFADGWADTLIASPPCQLWSMAGKGAAREHKEAIINLLLGGTNDFLQWGLDGTSIESIRAYGRSLGDENYLHVLVPYAYILRYRPQYVALEQVPTVQPVWDAYKFALERWGYSVATGTISAEQYGVPQTRKRAILIASRVRSEVQMPTPTHSRYYSRSPQKLDAGVQKWVSMAEALGWGATKLPYPTIASGTGAGGTDPAALGGSGARRNLYAERARGDWKPSGDADNDMDGGVLRLTVSNAATIQSFPGVREAQ